LEQEAQQRFSQNPTAVDVTDTWCEKHEIGAACTIPGNAFEGGGSGVCIRGITDDDHYSIILTCVRSPEPVIDRGVPEGEWQVDPYRCAHPDGVLIETPLPRPASAQSSVEPSPSSPPSGYKRTPIPVLAHPDWICTTPKLAVDRFCTGKAEGQSCTAMVAVGMQDPQPFEGVCKKEVETRQYYYQGHRVVTRPVLLCRPAHPVPAPKLLPLSPWRKLTD
jgi:hypothetical protein